MTRSNRARRLGLALAVGLALGVAGCGGGPAADPAVSSTTSSEAPVTAAAPADPGPTVLAESRPERVVIPAIGVDSGLMDLGLQADGALEVPPAGFPAGWYTGAPTPGELGPAVLAGHVDWDGAPGVFYRLRDLVPGDEISIVRADGGTALFRVDRVERFAKDAFPTADVYGDLDHAGLRVITCGGSFDPQARSYLDNIVVFAELVPPPA